jgi:hypothetical protein
MSHIVLLNGPPGSGKDTLALGIATRLSYRHLKFATPLKKAIPALFNLEKDVWDGLMYNAKEVKSPLLGGMSPREALIWLSEDACKPRLGEDFFGRRLVNQILDLGIPRTVISDSGFLPEAEVVVKAFSPESLALIRLHRPGHNFTGDSRGYIDLPGVRSVDLYNEYTPQELIQTAIDWLQPNTTGKI